MDFMSLAIELRARGHEIVGAVAFGASGCTGCRWRLARLADAEANKKNAQQLRRKVPNTVLGPPEASLCQ